MTVVSSHHICPSLCDELWTTKHLFCPIKESLGLPDDFFFLTSSLRLGLWDSIELKATTSIKEKLFISFWRKSWVWLDMLSDAWSLLGCFHLTRHSLSSLPWAYLTWKQFWSPLPSHHTLFGQGVFGRIDRNYSKNRIFSSQAVACHLVPSWFTGGFELPRLATQEATANRP